IINLTGFSGLTKSSPGDNATGGVTLYIHKSVLFSEIQLDTDLQAVAVRVSAKKTLTVCNIYLPPSLDVNFSALEHLIQQLPAPFVLVGDLNAHSPLWGDVRQDSRGQMIEELLNDYNLCLLNTGEPTYRHHSHHSFSVPDVSICDPSLALEFDWLTHKDLCGSDHFPIILKTSLRDDEPAAEHWKFDRADWMSFRTLCMSRLSDELALSEDPVAQFTNTLIEIANQTIPKSHTSKNKLPKVPWFNDACKQAIKERKKAQRKLFRNPTAENVLAFKQLKAKARHIIKTQKKTSWQNFCSSLTSKTKPKTVWKAIRKIKGKKSTSSLGHLKVNGKLLTDKKQIANL
ncbi:hypothetical protein, partial [Thiolapillus sp.]|uniref:hypothetical protein n=1 Tax=Thiolapillus sp. TaxID=2017437 RepID=UPI003AF6A5C6